MQKKLIHFILNPFIISALIAIGVIMMLPNYFSKYKVEKMIYGFNPVFSELNEYSYVDMDDDGKMERIMSRNNSSGNGSYMLYDSTGEYIDQFNFSESFVASTDYVWAQDADENGFSEVYGITYNRDSIYLEYNEPLGPKSREFHKIFVDTFPSTHDTSMVDGAGMINSALKEYDGPNVYFSIRAGFAGYPRHIYKYNARTGILLKSPHTTNPPNIQYILNLDEDEELELLISNTAPENELDTLYTKRSDYSTWLMALDDDLSFMFEPIAFETKGSLNFFPIMRKDELVLRASFASHRPKEVASQFFEVDLDGIIHNKKILEISPFSFISEHESGTMVTNDRTLSNIKFYDENFEIIKTVQTEGYQIVQPFDINNDDEEEWVGTNSDYSKFIIYDNTFKHVVEFSLEPSRSGYNSIVVWHNSNDNLLVIEKDSIEHFYRYVPSIYYWLRFPFYLGVYLAILLLTWLVLQGQKIRYKHQQELQKEISELQLKTIKNQVDPHFVFNAINTISEMTLMDNKLEADRFISRFSGFMRDTLKQSDKISTTLLDELEYTENFIKLQQIRYNDSFNYEINVDDSISKEVLIPKHVLFCYAENAIKHGLALKKNGFLRIEVKQENDKLLLSIQDNGGGIRVSDKPKKNSTGSGLKIMEKIFKLYTELNHQKISHRLIELKDESDNNCGIKVEVEIFNKKRKHNG